MRIRAVKFYENGVYHLYDDKHLLCPFLVKHGLNDCYEYTIKLYNEPMVCKDCIQNFKTLAFSGVICVPPIIDVWRK
jgi:hypothetical protein